MNKKRKAEEEDDHDVYPMLSQQPISEAGTLIFSFLIAGLVGAIFYGLVLAMGLLP